MVIHYMQDELYDVIHDLEEKYPRCFFVTPQLRRPLKTTIMEDLADDCFPASYSLLVAAVAWYKNHFAYQHALVAGAKRVDLDGKEVGTVTASEHLIAQKKIAADKQKVAYKAATTATKPPPPSPPVVAASPPPPPPPASSALPLIAPQVTRLYETLMTANAVFTGAGDMTLKTVMANAVLKILVQEAQRIVGELEKV